MAYRRWVEHVTPRGLKYSLWEREVPRIHECFADCSVYFYESEQDARDGSKFGGSGFLVHSPSNVAPNMGHIYVVTNKHVIDPPPDGGGCTVLRLTKKHGGIDTIPTQWADWIPDPDGDDVAVLPLHIEDFFRWWSVSTDTFITREIINAYRIGWGDEAFLVGRLIYHDGTQKNAPIIRFGNISLMADPSEPIKVTNRKQEGFLVECRSLSGFSGSPVFVSTTQAYHDQAAERMIELRKKEMAVQAMREGKTLDDPPPQSGLKLTAVSMQGTWGPWLLGIDWGHMPMREYVRRGGGRSKEKTEMYVDANTGIACVLPAWHILETLNVEVLVKAREEEDKKIAKLNSEGVSINDVADRETPFTKEDFQNALKQASRKVPPTKGA